MKKRIIVGIIVVVFVAVSFYFGMVCGRTQIASQDVSFNVVFATSVLKVLHGGDTNRVASLLNSLLDQNVFAIGTWRAVPFSKSYRKQMERALSHAATYRAEHPRSPIQLQAIQFNQQTRLYNFATNNDFAEQFNETVDRLVREAKPLDRKGQQTSAGDSSTRAARVSEPPEK